MAVIRMSAGFWNSCGRKVSEYFITGPVEVFCFYTVVSCSSIMTLVSFPVIIIVDYNQGRLALSLIMINI